MPIFLRLGGLAIATVLLAIVLVAAIAVVIASASRSGQSSSELQQARLDAATLMTQAQNYKNGLAIMESKGTDPSTITFDAAANTGLWNPVAGGTSEQVEVPLSAKTSFTDPSWFHWIYHGPSGVFKPLNVGTSAGSYAVAIIYLTNAVCQQINYRLFGSTVIPHASESASLSCPACVVDYSMDAATDQKDEQCISTVGGTNFITKSFIPSNTGRALAFASLGPWDGFLCAHRIGGAASLRPPCP